MVDDNHITVIVTLTQKDCAMAMRALAREGTGWIKRVAFWVSLAFLGWMFFAWLRISDRSLLAGTLEVAGVLLFVMGLSYVVPHFAARSFVKKNPNKLGPVTHSIGPDGTSYEGQHGSGRTTWEAYQRIRETKELFLLYPQSTFAQILPKRCFDNPRDIETYRQILRNYYKGKLKLLT